MSNAARSTTRASASVEIFPSACLVPPSERLVELVSQRDSSKSDKFRRKYSMLHHLLAELIAFLILPFEEMFQRSRSTDDALTNDHEGRVRFRDILTSKRDGIPVLIVTAGSSRLRYLVANFPVDIGTLDISDIAFVPNSALSSLLATVLAGDSEHCDDDEQRIQDDEPSYDVRNLIASMDTEWDRLAAKAICSLICSPQQLTDFGFSPTQFREYRSRALEIIDTLELATMESQDEVANSIAKSKEKLSNLIASKETFLNMRKYKLTAQEQDSQLRQINLLHDRLCSLSRLQDGGKEDQLRLKRMVKYHAQLLTEQRRLKKRALGAGAPVKASRAVELAVCAAIEERSSFHGRRHDTVLYSDERKNSAGERLKIRSLQDTANSFLSSSGSDVVIKSPVTIFNLMKPKRASSVQAQRHRGDGLFCTRKPPKTDGLDTEATHFQRKFISNIKNCLWSAARSDSARFCFMRSFDAKAFMRCGTDVGFTGMRNQCIVQPSNESKASKLPKYDFPISSQYLTPASHKIMRKKEQLILGVPTLITDNNTEIVCVRPKWVVSDTATTWANEDMELSYQHLQDWCVQPLASEMLPSTAFWRLCLRIQDAVSYFVDVSVPNDIVQSSVSHLHRLYEKKKVAHLIRLLAKAASEFNGAGANLPASESDRLDLLILHVQKLDSSANALVTALITEPFGDASAAVSATVDVARELLQSVHSFSLPFRAPRVAEITDAGPGVGIQNRMVPIRDAEIARLRNSDVRVRVHRAPGDPCEAERLNGAISDACVDGSTLEFDFFKRFHDLNDEEIQSLTSATYLAYENQRTEKNAWRACSVVCDRLQGAPASTTGETIKAHVADHPRLGFFWNEVEWLDFLSAKEASQASQPGYHYFKRIQEFVVTHYDIGVKYMEYHRDACREKPCQYHLEHSTSIGPPVSRFPRPVPDLHASLQQEKPCFLPWDQTPTAERLCDDTYPTTLLKRAFERGLRSSDAPTVEETAWRIGVDSDLASAKLRKWEEALTIQGIHQHTRHVAKVERAARRFLDYDWGVLISDHSLAKLTIAELDKYIHHFNLPRQPNKQRRLDVIEQHWCQYNTPPANLISRITNLSLTASVDSDSESENLDVEQELEEVADMALQLSMI